jgi:outer membrane receptor protein involved in Fe transport
MQKHIYCVLIAVLCLFLCANLQAATTGKIAGKVVDAQSQEPLPGANVVISGTNLGGATNISGEYFIINIPPGTYTLEVTMIGYARTRAENIRVSSNSTSTIDFNLKVEAVEGEEVVVTASAMSFKKDQTSSVRNVSSEQIEVLPVQNINDLLGLQAGVVDGHFRGGRSDEVSYMIDGVPIDDRFNNSSRMANIETDAIEDLEVITGTFNAEYGRAMSGVVNAVTKDGGNEIHGSFTGSVGNYYTGNSDIFIGLENSEINRNQDYKFQLSGPIFKNKLTFFANVRHQNNKNHLNSQRRFLMDDYSNYSFSEPTEWIDIHRGDNEYVPLNDSENQSVFAKLTWSPIQSMKLSGAFTHNDDEWGSYSHTWKYAPDGKSRFYKTNELLTFTINHTVAKNLFYELKASYNDLSYGNYLYEDPLDDRYISNQYGSSAGPGFQTGGQQRNHTLRNMKDTNLKYDLTWQMNNNHSVKAGALYIDHQLEYNWHQIQNRIDDATEFENYWDAELGTYVFPNYEPVIYGDSSAYGEEYDVNPTEFAAYIQDKMEFDQMVLNFGLRYDWFKPNSVYPTNLRNPGNQISNATEDRKSEYLDAEAQYQLSPRFGLSYQLSDVALLRFSYGHFFQMPPLYALYTNHSFLVVPQDYATQMGNPRVKAQKTVQYEMGFWYNPDLWGGSTKKSLAFEVNLFYRDIYDLLSLRILSTYNQIQYGLYSNKDYGNVKGIELNTDFKYNNFSGFLNYSLQYTRGIADSPTTTFDRAGNNQDPIPYLIPMAWDQRHTVKFSLSYNVGRASASLTSVFNTGQPYTWSPITQSRLAQVNLLPNNQTKPNLFTTDFFAFYDVGTFGRYKVRVNLLVENLLDRMNELSVNGQTGRANEAIIEEHQINSHRSLFNEYEDRINNPASFSAPRYVKLGLGVHF